MVLGRLTGTREFCIKQVDNKDLWILGRGIKNEYKILLPIFLAKYLQKYITLTIIILILLFVSRIGRSVILIAGNWTLHHILLLILFTQTSQEELVEFTKEVSQNKIKTGVKLKKLLRQNQPLTIILYWFLPKKQQTTQWNCKSMVAD